MGPQLVGDDVRSRGGKGERSAVCRRRRQEASGPYHAPKTPFKKFLNRETRETREQKQKTTTNGHEWTQIQTGADVFQLLVFIGVHLLAKVFGVRGFSEV